MNMNILIIVRCFDVMRLFIITYSFIYLIKNGKLYNITDDFIISYPLIYLTFEIKSDNEWMIK